MSAWFNSQKPLPLHLFPFAALLSPAGQQQSYQCTTFSLAESHKCHIAIEQTHTMATSETAAATTPESFKHLYENLILIDGAANLVHKKYSRDQESVIQRAKDAGQSNFIH